MMLPDLLDANLRVVFCGTAASTRSAEKRHYYAGPGNKFWTTLFEIGLTPEQLAPAEYRRVRDYGIGLTDMVKHKSGMDDVLQAADFYEGRRRLLQQIRLYQPSLLCFNGKRAAKGFLNRSELAYGLQKRQIGDTNIYVAPSTSGAARRWWNFEIWQELTQLIGS